MNLEKKPKRNTKLVKKPHFKELHEEERHYTLVACVGTLTKGQILKDRQTGVQTDTKKTKKNLTN